ncbi:MAG: iron chelate uptake ABC transporter family permease subunit [Chitinophagales bacterium]
MTDLIEFLSLSDANIRYVVLGMILLGACSGIVGTFTFLRKRALIGDAIAHAVLPGVCLAFMLTGNKNPLVLLAGAVTTGWLSLVLIDWITAKSRIKADAAIGLTLSVFFGIGILLLTLIQKSGAASQSGLDKFLFGKAASLVGDDLIIFGTLSIVLISVVALFFKPFTLISFDEAYAQSIGLPVRFIELVLASITVLAVAVGIQAVGVVLMAALLISPAAAARYWTNQLSIMVVLAAIFGAVSGIFGAYISYTQPAMPTGPWIVVILTAIAVFSMLFAPKRGVFARYLKRRSNQMRILEENVLKIFFQLGELDEKAFAYRGIGQLKGRRYLKDKTIKTALKRLMKKGYTKVKENQGVLLAKLTDKGLQTAKRQVKIHRLWEVYLTQYLKVAPDHVHDDAEAIEHIITPELEKELEHLLQNPPTDPHGTPIPYQ